MPGRQPNELSAAFGNRFCRTYLDAGRRVCREFVDHLGPSATPSARRRSGRHRRRRSTVPTLPSASSGNGVRTTRSLLGRVRCRRSPPDGTVAPTRVEVATTPRSARLRWAIPSVATCAATARWPTGVRRGGARSPDRIQVGRRDRARARMRLPAAGRIVRPAIPRAVQRLRRPARSCGIPRRSRLVAGTRGLTAHVRGRRPAPRTRRPTHVRNCPAAQQDPRNAAPQGDKQHATVTGRTLVGHHRVRYRSGVGDAASSTTRTPPQ